MYKFYKKFSIEKWLAVVQAVEAGERDWYECFSGKVNITVGSDALSHVWTNFLHNSIVFTDRNGKVKIDLREKNNVIRF